MGFVAKVEKHIVVPEGVYDAILKNVEPREGGIDSKGFWLWAWEVTDPATGEPIEVTRPSSPKLTTGTNAGQWIKTIRGKSVDEQKQFDFTSIEGAPCRLVIGVVEKDKGTFNEITAIMPPVMQTTIDEEADDAPI